MSDHDHDRGDTGLDAAIIAGAMVSANAAGKRGEEFKSDPSAPRPPGEFREPVSHTSALLVVVTAAVIVAALVLGISAVNG